VILIDGYNLLFAIVKTTKNVERDREQLIGRLVRFADATRQRLRVFFDHSGPRRERRSQVEIVYVQEDMTADERIVAALDATDDRTAYRVVTSDAEIRRAAERRRFEVTSSADFARELERAEAGGSLAEPLKKEHGISPAEADQWMKAFGIGGDDDQV